MLASGSEACVQGLLKVHRVDAMDTHAGGVMAQRMLDRMRCIAGAGHQQIDHAILHAAFPGNLQTVHIHD